jgi:hypothetical protein
MYEYRKSIIRTHELEKILLFRSLLFKEENIVEAHNTMHNIQLMF